VIIDLSNMNPSDYAAWWGATIATLALVWNIVVALRTGARLHVTVAPNMEFFPATPREEGKKHIIVSAVNRGTSPTTITHFLGYADESWWGRFNKKKRQHFIVMPKEGSSSIPMKIEPGDEWRGIADQEGVLDGVNKHVYIGVAHNQHKKSVYKRVKIRV